MVCVPGPSSLVSPRYLAQCHRAHREIRDWEHAWPYGLLFACMPFMFPHFVDWPCFNFTQRWACGVGPAVDLNREPCFIFRPVQRLASMRHLILFVVIFSAANGQQTQYECQESYNPDNYKGSTRVPTPRVQEVGGLTILILCIRLLEVVILITLVASFLSWHVSLILKRNFYVTRNSPQSYCYSLGMVKTEAFDDSHFMQYLCVRCCPPKPPTHAYMKLIPILAHPFLMWRWPLLWM